MEWLDECLRRLEHLDAAERHLAEVRLHDRRPDARERSRLALALARERLGGAGVRRA